MTKRDSLLLDHQWSKPNVVIRDVRDRDGCKLGRVIQAHDGTEDGVIAAAQSAAGPDVVTRYSSCEKFLLSLPIPGNGPKKAQPVGVKQTKDLSS